MTVIVVAAIIRRDGKILITRRFDHVHMPGLWEFPGGKVERGESLQGALRREIREELGLEITVGSEFFSVQYAYPSKTVDLHFYNCTPRGEPRAIEVAEMRWVIPDELGAFDFPPADKELIDRLRTSANEA